MILPKNTIHSFYKIIQTLSLDVVIGVLAMAYFSVTLLEIDPIGIWWFILTLAVWSFYTVDHLIDGSKSKGKTVIYRHSFHHKNKSLLSVLSILFGLTSLVLSLIFLDFRIIKFGLVIGLIVLAYFLVLTFQGKKKSIVLQKEIIIAFIYISGIWLAPLVWKGSFPNIFVIITITILFLLAWVEGIMASYFDYQNDLKENHSSFSILFGKSNTRKFLILLHIIIFILITLSVFSINSVTQIFASLILTLMNLSLLLILLFPFFNKKNDRYRVFGEMIFWLPIIIFFADLF